MQCNSKRTPTTTVLFFILTFPRYFDNTKEIVFKFSMSPRSVGDAKGGSKLILERQLLPFDNGARDGDMGRAVVQDKGF